jgi:hypothetical protein
VPHLGHGSSLSSAQASRLASAIIYLERAYTGGAPDVAFDLAVVALFGILKQADPALVDPGVTAQLECLLDDVVVGKQEMVGAIDAVCSVAQRIIGKLKGV